jgi:hypothetical protein
VLRIKQLLYEEGFTIAGAKKRLEAEMTGRGTTPTSLAGAASGAETEPIAAAALAPEPPRPPAAVPMPQADPAGDKTRAVLLEVKNQLREMLTLLDKGDRKNP